ncbi:MAG: D-xylose ABC transporter ATP-binding protein [Thermoprotei archaeon]|nr:MAG: D-xylose ABC transporter ATP-binding protein [Thermoprotei archaeon]
MEYILEMKNITKIFPGGFKALDNVDFDLKKGEVHVLLGENGAGKSTLIKVLLGVHKRDSGKIILWGEEVDIKNPKEAFKRGISVIYQELSLFPHLTVAENISVINYPLSKFIFIRRREMIERARKILESLEIDINPLQLVKNLNVSERQLVEIARAFSYGAKIIIMDEPTTALSIPERKRLFGVIKTLKRKGISIIYITHFLEEVFEIGDRVTILRDGKKVGTYAVSDVNEDTIIRLMTGKKSLFANVTRGEVSREKEEVLRIIVKTDSERYEIPIYSGEVLGIAGPIGAGKTELVKAIYGALRRKDIELICRGQKIVFKKPQKAVKFGIGYLPEDRDVEGLFMNRSVLENISIASLWDLIKGLLLINKSAEKKKVIEVFKTLDIKARSLDQKVRYLSGGNKQKVVVARWLCKKPRIIIFDEPTRGIDIPTKIQIYNIIRELAAQGYAVILSSSEFNEIASLCDRAIVLRQGRIIAEVKGSELNEHKLMSLALGGGGS